MNILILFVINLIKNGVQINTQHENKITQEKIVKLKAYN